MPFASLSPATDHHPSSPSTAPPLTPREDAQWQQQQAMSGRWPAPLTPAQYEELEQQALIYKYLLAGVPVPPELLVPIRRGFVYHQPPLGYGPPYFGKKVDLEPGRCRRTDGKKWRCSKEAAPDSKYCERHMQRGRNRSRKPVEPQLVAAPISQPPAQANLAGGCQNHTLYSAIAGSGSGAARRGGGAAGVHGLGSAAQMHMNNAAPYATAAGGGSKDLRYSSYGTRTLAAEQSQLISGGTDSWMENSWLLLPSQTSTFQVSSYPLPLYGTLSGLDESTTSSLPKTERQPVSLFGSDFAKQENQTLRPFFDEWPKSRGSWSELADDNSLSSFSATQLSISIPMGTSTPAPDD